MFIVCKEKSMRSHVHRRAIHSNKHYPEIQTVILSGASSFGERSGWAYVKINVQINGFW